jgi:hypothetical protein
LAVAALGLYAWAPAVQAASLGGADFNDGSGNAPGLSYSQGSITIGEAGDNKAWSFSPVQWIDVDEVSSGSVFLRALVRRESDEAQWGGVSLFTDDQSDEIMYNGAATSDGDEPRAFLGFHDQESGAQAASPARFEVGETLLMVTELDIDGGEARMWVNPAFGATPPVPDLTAPFAMTDAGKAVGSVRLNAGAAGFITGDEIAVGTAWTDVVPVPEPSSLLLLVAGLCALAVWRRR